jgi:tetratricopeptide (TPR) repeat protein
VRGWYIEAEATYQSACEHLQGMGDSARDKATDWPIARGYVLGGQGWFCVRQGRHNDGRDLMLEGLTLLEQYDPTRELGEVLILCGVTYFLTGHYIEAQSLMRRGLVILRVLGDRWFEAMALGNLGLLSQARGHYQRADRLMRAATSLFTEIGDQRMIGVGKSYLSSVAYALGEYGRARDLLHEGIAISRALDDRWNVTSGLVHLQELSFLLGEYAEVRHYHAECAALCYQISELYSLSRSLNILGRTAYAQGMQTEAWEYFCKALAVAQEAKLIPVALDVLIGVATIMHDEGDDESAHELLTFVLHHSASRADTHSRAGEMLGSWGTLMSSSASRVKFVDETATFDLIMTKILNTSLHSKSSSRAVNL